MASTPTAASPQVSVVIATYNMARYLASAVDSVLAQTGCTFDVHVVDDGSTDDTSAVLERYRDDSRVNVHVQQNAGQTAAKNRGIRESRGELIAFLDADDYWLPHKLSVQVPAMLESDAIGVVYGKEVRLAGDTGQLSDAPHEDFPSGRVTDRLLVSNFVSFGTALVRRRCLDELGAFDERYRMGIDWELWLRLSTRYEFRFVDDVVLVYRVWSGQMSRNWRGRYEHVFRIMDDFLERYPAAATRDAVQLAYADSYTNRARIRSHRSGEHWRAVGDIASALSRRPAYAPAWRTLAHVARAAAQDALRPSGRSQRG